MAMRTTGGSALALADAVAPVTVSPAPIASPAAVLQRSLTLPWPIAAAVKVWLRSDEHEALLKLARDVTGCPTAFVTTPVDVAGDDGDVSGLGQTGHALCAQVHVHGGVFVVSDAASDPHFKEDLMVHSFPHGRFFVGAPILVQGQAVGTLVAIDYQPRAGLDDEASRSFATLATFCGHSIDVTAREMAVPSERSQVQLMAARANAAVLDVSSCGRIMAVNRAASRLLREPADVLLNRSIGDYVVGWPSLVHVIADKALDAATRHLDLVDPILVEIATEDGAIVPSRASITFQIDGGVARYRLVLEELP